jgi:hypothetical protein
MTDAADYEKLSKDAIVSLLKSGGDTGAPKVAALVCQLIAQAARGTHDARASVTASVRGSMSGVIVGGPDLAEVSVKILETLPNMSLMSRVGPEEIMSAVLEGIADLTPLMPPNVKDSISAHLEEKFMGAGEVFDGLCQKARQKKA